MYLRLPYLGNKTKFLEKKVRHTTNRFGAVNLQISNFTRKPLAGIFKDVTPDPEKNNVIYQFKCHCVYIERTSQRFHLRRGQQVSKRNWMVNRDSKPTKSLLAIGDHLLNYPEIFQKL